MNVMVWESLSSYPQQLWDNRLKADSKMGGIAAGVAGWLHRGDLWNDCDCDNPCLLASSADTCADIAGHTKDIYNWVTGPETRALA